MEITWGKGGGASGHGRIEGTDYRCERYKTRDGMYWFLLSNNKLTYLCCKGPYYSAEERDEAIFSEVTKRISNGKT